MRIKTAVSLRISGLVAVGRAETNFSSRTGHRRLTSCVSLLAVAAVLCPAVAWAERAIEADVAAAVPFDGRALASALRVRTPAEGDAIHIQVTPTSEGVRVETRGTTRDVALRGLVGDAAARLVALAAADLLVDASDLEPPPFAAPGRHRLQTTLGLLGSAGAWGRTLGAVGLDLAIPRRSYVIAIEAGAGTLVDGPLRLTTGIVRAGLGIRRGDLELRVTATAAPLVVSSGTGDATILAGAGASLRLRLPLARDLHAVVAAGADAFATQTTYVVDGMTSLTTPRVAPWAALGLELAP